jgi:hypothetical protein
MLLVTTLVYASSQGQRTHSTWTNNKMMGLVKSVQCEVRFSVGKGKVDFVL